MVSEDRDSVERVLSGETGAFERLVRKYARLAGAIAYGVLGDLDLAEDVVQEAFLRAYRGLGTLRDPSRFRVWLGGIVRRRAIDVLRQETTRRTLDLEGEDVAGSVVSSGLPPDARLEGEERQRKVAEALAELPEEDRTVLALKHMEGLSYKEIGEITGFTVSAVESRLFRARRALAEKLAPQLRSDSV